MEDNSKDDLVISTIILFYWSRSCNTILYFIINLSTSVV